MHLPPALRTEDRLLYPQLRGAPGAAARARAVDDGPRHARPRAFARSSPPTGPTPWRSTAPASSSPRSTTWRRSSPRGSSAPTTSTPTRACAWPRRPSATRARWAPTGRRATYADLERGRLLLPDRHQHRRLPPHRLEAHPEAEARRPRRRLRDRRRPALHGDRRHRRPAPAAPARLGHRAAERDAVRALRARAARSRPSSPATRRAGTACARSSSALSARARVGASPGSRPRAS